MGRQIVGGVVMNYEEEYDIISLGPDMSQVWGRVTKHLRENNDPMYVVLMGLDVEFDRETIIINTLDSGTYALVARYKSLFDEIAGSGIIEIYKPEQAQKKTELTAKLREMFGDRLVVKA